MSTPGSLTVSGFAALARRQILTEMEVARAGREPDEARVPGGIDEIALEPALLERLRTFLAPADHLPPEEFPDLPDDLARPIIAALSAAPAGEAPTSPVPAAAARRRSEALVGRAMMVRRALITNDRSLARDAVDRVAASAGIEIPPNLRPVVERASLRVLEEVFREGARRELGVYAEPPEDDPSLRDLRLPVSSAAPMTVPQPAPLPPAEEPPSSRPQAEPAPTAAVSPAPTGAPASVSSPSTVSSFVEAFFEKRTKSKKNPPQHVPGPDDAPSVPRGRGRPAGAGLRPPRRQHVPLHPPATPLDLRQVAAGPGGPHR